MKKLPIGISTFNKIIDGNYLYIDKTDLALDLIENYNYSFLSRPRRFGKSLFISTLKEIFEGNRKLFEGLYIYDKWDWEDKYPVIKISFGGSRNTDELKQSIFKALDFAKRDLGIECKENYDYAICFSDLIEKSYEKYQKPVVILIDEYDKPILDNLDQMEVAQECREILKRLYTQIKENDKYIRFAFLTGVSKFTRASIFSGLNNLRDISMLPQYGNICGYTHQDIETTFKPYLEGVDLEELRVWYDGYNFLKDKVYNPFDILLFIDSGCVFDNYWFNTGTPSFLLKLFKAKNYNLAQFENLKAEKSILDSFDIEKISLETVMFQSGYLTIKEVVQRRRKIEYILDYPNLETKMSFNSYLLDYFVEQHSKKNEVQNGLIDKLEEGDLNSLEITLKSLFASIAYHNFTKNDIEKYEGFYASVIYAYFAGAGFDKIVAEAVTNDGRIDLSVFIDDKVYIFEFKVNQSGALRQIKDKNYQQPYEAFYNEIYIIGVEFDSKKRNVVWYEWERVKG
ncbi:MAG TPA: hypothetical protein ENK66_06585 [Arcobacter sp.]|nr:hypothetical protein [Arcobacter sp.]